MTYAPQRPPEAVMRNGFGITALVLGIIGLVFSFIPVIGMIAWPLTIVGLIFGVLGILRAGKGGADNRGMAITGTALSGVGLAVCLLWTIALVAFAQVDTSAQPFGAPARQQDDIGPPPQPGNAPQEQVPDGTIPGDGTFVVGSEVQPGTYKTQGVDGFACHYARLADTSGEPQAIIAYDIPQGPTTVTIEDSDGAFETNGCQPWEKAD